MGRLAALMAAGLVSGGCSLLFGDVSKSECRIPADCPPGEVCVDAWRCRPAGALPDHGPEPEPVPDPDADLDAAPPPDATPPVDLGPDVEVDASRDLGPDAEPERVPFGLEGDCFGGARDGLLDLDDPPLGAAHAPRPACTPHAVLWTVLDEGEVTLAWDTDGDGRAEGTAPLDGRYAVGGGALFAPRFDGETVRVVRIDPISGAEAALRTASDDHRDPVYHGGRVALVETLPGRPTSVAIVDETPGGPTRELSCARDGHRQWGPALGEGFVGWLEQPLGGRRTRVVVLDGPLCFAETARRELVLPVQLDDEARLFAIDGGVVWLEPREDDRGDRLRRWRFTDPRAVPETLAIVGGRLVADPAEPAPGPNPVELDARGRHLALVAYRAGNAQIRFALYRIDLATGQAEVVRQAGDAHAPWLSATYLTWAQTYLDGTWSVAYERLTPD